MPVYKDQNKWIAKFYYVDHNGIKKQKLKRGFKTKREAKEFENHFLVKHQKDITMPFFSISKVLQGRYRNTLKTFYNLF